MKLLIILLTIFSLCSCKTTITSPATKIEYTGEVNKEGLSITIKPPFWVWAVDLYKKLSP